MSASRSLLQTSPLTTPAAPGLSTAHIWSDAPAATIKTHVGGSLTEISWPNTYLSRGSGGGRRGKVSGFSRASRRRLLQLLNSLNRNEVKTLPLFITLTYPARWPDDPKVWKDHLDKFKRRMRRKFGPFAAVWRLEFQKRGAPHFHLLVFLQASAQDLYNWVSAAWYEVCGEICPEHLRAGTRVESVRSWRGVVAYAAKYMGKLEKLAVGVRDPGRFWGRWSGDLLPISPEETTVAGADANRIRRILRKFAGIRPRGMHKLYGLKVFASYTTTNRLLASYGYYRK